ncbi:MAG TPA: hypothetical protein VJM78_02695 [Rhizomicrobium sp.]|nr:hypothetical protein [Rhizomicrobium sp.]
MKFELSKDEAAADQLDWAIRLFLDHDAYVAAITLAGAAEELIGKPLQEQAVFKQLTQTLSVHSGLDPKSVTQNHLNKAKNWLKHWDEHTDQGRIELELDEEALQYIVRALTNFANYDNSLPSEAPRFWEWLQKNRPELFVD